MNMNLIWARRASAFASGSLAALIALRSDAADVTTSLPHGFWLGAPRGAASAREVDASGSRQATPLPNPEAARVAWQRRIGGGASANVLVDATGALFVPGLRVMTELAADGSLRHELPAPSAPSAVAALLGDGTRVVLTRDGRLLGWSDTGASALEVDLPAPPPSAAVALVPLGDGGLLVAIGRWLFAFDASRGSPVYTSVPSTVALVRQVGPHVLIVDDRGRVFEWRRGNALRDVGELSGPASAALGDGSSLVALTTARTLETLDASTGRRSELARFDAPGPLPVIARSEPGTWVTIGPEGDWMKLGASFPTTRSSPRREGGHVRDPQLLVDAQGGVAHWAANRPLTLAAAGVERELGDVRCADPLALAPAGAGRLVAVCGSGSLWLVEAAVAPATAGPAALAPREALASAPGTPYIGPVARHWQQESLIRK
jgi:hypothetical protein